MVFARLPVLDKKKKNRFLKKTFLLVNTSMRVVLGMLFLSFSNADINFVQRLLERII